MTRIVTCLCSLLLCAAPSIASEAEDPYLWLEDVLGERAIAWVKEQNSRALAELQASPRYQPLYERTLEIYDSRDRIPQPDLQGSTVYNFWQDEKNPRGILRRTTLSSYRKAAPAWETVLDIDALSRAEDEAWVYKSIDCLAPEYRRCMVELSRGGSDASEYREFDASTLSFIKDGFFLPEAKSGVAWKGADTLWVATDWGPGSLTSSGYARIVKEWRRGTPASAARTLFEIDESETGTWPETIDTAEGRYNLVHRRVTFFEGDVYLALGQRLARLDLPTDADLKTIFRDQVLVSLRSDWDLGGRTYAAGALLAIGLDGLLQGRPAPEVLFEPTARVSLDSVAATRDRLLYTTLDNVRSRLYQLTYTSGHWTRSELPLPGLGAATFSAAADDADFFFYTYEDFVTPDALYLVNRTEVSRLKSLPAFFDTSGVTVTQREATSRDGTRIPYFLVMPRGFKADGTAPTLLYGYGGFEVSMAPSYSATVGASWIERGGVFVLANIRGGGEFGPAWHQAAVRANRMRNFEDFTAVAEHLIETGVTTPRHLGIMGGSQGGLLVAGSFTLRPELFNAVVSQVPLLDMRRYHKLLAGASWMSEYGNPDKPEDWAYIQTWSPYHLLKKDARYPKAFFWTTTRDDRVHPGHARKMVAKTSALGHPVLYFENIEGGHGSGSVNTQRAQINALQYSYLWEQLGN